MLIAFRNLVFCIFGFAFLVSLNSRKSEEVVYDPRSVSARHETTEPPLDNERIFADAAERTQKRTGRSALSIAVRGPDQADLDKAAAREYWRVRRQQQGRTDNPVD